VKPIDISVLHNAEPELLEIAAAAAAMLDAHDADVVNQTSTISSARRREPHSAPLSPR